MSRGKYGTDGDKIQEQLDALKAEVTMQMFTQALGKTNALDGLKANELSYQIQKSTKHGAPSLIESVPAGSSITPLKTPSEQKSGNLEFF